MFTWSLDRSTPLPLESHLTISITKLSAALDIQLRKSRHFWPFLVMEACCHTSLIFRMTNILLMRLSSGKSPNVSATIRSDKGAKDILFERWLIFTALFLFIEAMASNFIFSDLPEIGAKQRNCFLEKAAYLSYNLFYLRYFCSGRWVRKARGLS